MKSAELLKFANQLKIWTEEIIENGRTPFRRVDLYPRIHTATGQQKPPLIFWINRQSMMAGGILLLPDQDLESELQRGRSCAEALGLRHFVTWENTRVRIWQLSEASVTTHQEFSVEAVETPEAFRQLLSKILEALKLLAVIGLIPAAELSPHYLHNLFQTALDLAQPSLIKQFRSQRAASDEASKDDADRSAEEYNRLLLIQLLALLWTRQLPSAILPEKLERAIELSLPQLPKSLQYALLQGTKEDRQPLPHDAAVCFHHLLLRLRQLNWDQPSTRAQTSIKLLFEAWYPTEVTPPAPPASFWLYPQSPHLQQVTSKLLSDSPGLLAATGLLEHLNGESYREKFFGNLFSFTPETLPQGSIGGWLMNTALPSREERQQFSALLRVSWPNRRFRLPATTPIWLWEAMHLLGIYRHGEPLFLSLPNALLTLPEDDPFWLLLFENYQIVQLQLLTERVDLQLRRDSDSLEPIDIFHGDEKRQLLPKSKSPQDLRAQLLTTALLPKELFRLVSDEFVWEQTDTLPPRARTGLRLFSESGFAAYLRQILGQDCIPLPNELGSADNTSCFCHPDPRVLEELARKHQTDQQAEESLDQLLADLLGCPSLSALTKTVPSQSSPQLRTSGKSQKQMQDELVQQLEAEGLPIFPEKYLYFLDQPKMQSYRFTPPLKVANEFLGQVELIDAADQSLTVYGDELTQALLLCSAQNRTEVDLPVDRQQLNELLDHYRQDLKALHSHLNSLCFSKLESSKSAKKLVQKTWKSLNLPARKWFAD